MIVHETANRAFGRAAGSRAAAAAAERSPGGGSRAHRALDMLDMGALLAAAPARLAPMAGLTNASFREAALRCGSGFTTHEEIDAAALLRGAARPGDVARTDAAGPRTPDLPVAMQLLGNDAPTLVEAARRLVAAGADIVDLNMGCPTPKIVRRGKGAALMRDVPATARILDALRRALPGVPLTIKIRGGWDDRHRNAVEVARMAQDVGVDAITVHPRTRAERFDGRAPWETIAAVVQAVDLPVTGNGDVHSLAEARRMMRETGCRDVMIGRGALGRPWIFDPAYPALGPAERAAYRRRAVDDHLHAIARTLPPREALVQSRKHLALYVARAPGARDRRREIFACADLAQLQALAGRWLGAAWEAGETHAPHAADAADAMDAMDEVGAASAAAAAAAVTQSPPGSASR